MLVSKNYCVTTPKIKEKNTTITKKIAKIIPKLLSENLDTVPPQNGHKDLLGSPLYVIKRGVIFFPQLGHVIL